MAGCAQYACSDELSSALYHYSAPVSRKRITCVGFGRSAMFSWSNRNCSPVCRSTAYTFTNALPPSEVLVVKVPEDPHRQNPDVAILAINGSYRAT